MDKDNVIKGLENIQKHLDTGYSFAISWKSELIRDALALLKEQDDEIYALRVDLASANELAEGYAELLKEQEAVEPIKMQRMDGNFSFFVPYFLCGNCRYELVGKDVMFCHHCGRQVKWE